MYMYTFSIIIFYTTIATTKNWSHSFWIKNKISMTRCTHTHTHSIELQPHMYSVHIINCLPQSIMSRSNGAKCKECTLTWYMMLIICQSLYPCAGVLYIMCYIMVLATTVVGVQPLRTGCMGVCLCWFCDGHCACISTVKMSQSLSLPHTSIYCTLFIISPSPTLSLSLSFHDTYLAKIMYQSCFYNK